MTNTQLWQTSERDYSSIVLMIVPDLVVISENLQNVQRRFSSNLSKDFPQYIFLCSTINRRLKFFVMPGIA